MDLSGLASFLVSVYLAITALIYALVTVLYALIRHKPFTSNPISTHLLGSGTVILLSILIFALTLLADKRMLGLSTQSMDHTIPLWAGLIVVIWCGINWQLGSVKYIYPVLAAVSAGLTITLLYLMLT